MTSAFDEPIRRLRLESAWLQHEFLQAVKNGRHRRTQLTAEMVVIRLHDAWARFCRELIILSAFGRTRTLSGVPLAPCSAAITSRSLVVPTLFSTYKKKKIRFEPRWADATECINAGQRLLIRNLSTVAGALGAINSPAEDIRRVRNFYAHREKETARDAIATNAFSTRSHPEIFDLAAYTSGNVRVIESWVTNLVLVATSAAQ